MPAPAPTLTRELLRLAVPALATLLAEPLLILADTWIVGHLGTPQLAGLTIATTVIGVLVGLSIFLAYGTTATVSRRLGAGNRTGALSGGVDGMVLGALLGTALAAVLLATAPAVVGLFGATAAASAHATTYLRIVGLGLPAMLVVLAATGILRGLQDTRTPLVVVVGMNLTNIALNLALVLGLGLGIGGAALGTAISQWLGATVFAAVVIRGAHRAGTPFAFRPAGILTAAREGSWLVLRTAALQAALVITTLTAAGIGETALAAHQVTASLWTTTAFALDALAIAAQAMVGLRLGAGDRDGAHAITRRVVAWGAGFGVVVGGLIVAARPVLAGFFTPDDAVRALLAVTLLVLAAFAPIGGITFALDGVLIGAGDARYLALAGAITTGLYAPLALAVHLTGGGLAWLWLAYGGWITFRAVALWWRARGEAWMRLGEA